jgi:exosome complex RNA-binding protein Rrp42 (RNase PH superfamily)
MNEVLFQRIFPLEYIMRHVNNGEREDGRKERQWREISIQRSNLISFRNLIRNRI